MNYNNIKRSQSMICQECGGLVTWRDSDDDFFDKLIYHMKNDVVCIRERKLNELLGTKLKVG